MSKSIAILTGGIVLLVLLLCVQGWQNVTAWRQYQALEDALASNAALSAQLDKMIKEKKEPDKQFSDAIEGVIASANAKLDKLLKSREETDKRNDDAIKTVVSSAVQQAMADLVAKTDQRLTAAISGLDTKIDRVNDQRLAGLTQSATDAAARANELIASGQIDMAQVFLLNAINHAPENILVLQQYVDLVLTSKSQSLDSLDKAGGVIELAVYQMAPVNIDTAMALHAKIDTAREKLMASLASPVQAANWDDEYVKLVGMDANKLAADDRALTEHLSALQECYLHFADLGTDAALTKAQTVETHIKRWSDVRSTKSALEYLTLCCARISSESDLTSDTAMSLASAAESALAQLWSVPESSLPDSVKKAVREQPAKVKDQIRRILNARAKKQLEIINSCRLNLDKQLQTIRSSGKPHPQEDACNAIEVQLRQVAEAMAQINGEADDFKAAKDAMEDMGTMLRNERQAQYNAYQKWALNVCRSASENFNKEKVVDDEDATRIYCYSNDAFDQIDIACLSPEVATLYADIRGKLFAEMTPRHIIDMSTKTNEVKRSLGAF